MGCCEMQGKEGHTPQQRGLQRRLPREVTFELGIERQRSTVGSDLKWKEMMGGGKE
jgi:hypothetical protein